MCGFENDRLAPAERLALAYAPSASRSAMAAISALDARLARAAMEASEPIIAQMKLAWWRDRFDATSQHPPVVDPLVQSLAALQLAGTSLCAMVDAWELFAVAEDHRHVPWLQWAEGRASGWAAVAARIAGPEWGETAQRAGQRWYLAEWAAGLSDPDLRAGIVEAGRGLGAKPVGLPRSLRPYAVLDALARRSLEHGEHPLAGPAAMAVAMRVGIFGR